MNTETKSTISGCPDTKRDAFIDLKTVGMFVLVLTVLNILWFSFDFHFPTQDEAEHIMNSITAKDLLKHFHPWSQHWWYQVLTINCFYPPFAYMVNGCFMLLFGQSRGTEQLSLTFFLCLAAASTYGIVRLLRGNRFSACLSAVCLTVYPIIAQLGHSFFLDLPEVAMTAFSLMTLLWWRRENTPDWKATILCAAVLAMSCLTKQLVAAFILPVCLYLFVDSLGMKYPFQKPRWNWARHLIIMGLITAAIGLPFIFINYKPTHEMTSLLMGDFAIKKVHWSYLDRLQLYLPLVPKVMSPFLFAVFIGSLFSRRELHLRLLPLSISALGGLLLMFAWPGNGLDHRYLAPALIAPAVYSGFLLSDLLYSGNFNKKALAIVLIAITYLQYIYCNFAPYPIKLPALSLSLENYLAKSNPNPQADWGHALVIDTIKKVDGSQPVYLNVMTNLGPLHTHAFELLFKEGSIHTIIPTTSRAFTIFGDKVQFNQKDALQYQWYLWKTGDVGYIFFDKVARFNFDQLVDFIRNSGNYKLMAEKLLPDGSRLMLYRRNS